MVTPNDDNANAVIAVLQKDKIPPKTFPTTGQDASPSGLQNILKGYQCGTVYKPIYLEAQAAAALAMYLRAGETPPATLVNAQTMDTTLGKNIASVYTTPDLGHDRQHGRHSGQGRRRQGRPTSAPAPCQKPARRRASATTPTGSGRPLTRAAARRVTDLR